MSNILLWLLICIYNTHVILQNFSLEFRPIHVSSGDILYYVMYKLFLYKLYYVYLFTALLHFLIGTRIDGTLFFQDKKNYTLFYEISMGC